MPQSFNVCITICRQCLWRLFLKTCVQTSNVVAGQGCFEDQGRNVNIVLSVILFIFHLLVTLKYSHPKGVIHELHVHINIFPCFKYYYFYFYIIIVYSRRRAASPSTSSNLKMTSTLYNKIGLIPKQKPIRVMIMGQPGVGKTGKQPTFSFIFELRINLDYGLKYFNPWSYNDSKCVQLNVENLLYGWARKTRNSSFERDFGKLCIYILKH